MPKKLVFACFYQSSCRGKGGNWRNALWVRRALQILRSFENWTQQNQEKQYPSYSRLESKIHKIGMDSRKVEYVDWRGIRNFRRPTHLRQRSTIHSLAAFTWLCVFTSRIEGPLIPTLYCDKIGILQFCSRETNCPAIVFSMRACQNASLSLNCRNNFRVQTFERNSNLRQNQKFLKIDSFMISGTLENQKPAC